MKWYDQLHQHQPQGLKLLLAMSVWCLVGNGGMGYGDCYWRLCRAYCRDPLPHSLLRLRTRQMFVYIYIWPGKVNIYVGSDLARLASMHMDVYIYIHTKKGVHIDFRYVYLCHSFFRWSFKEVPSELGLLATLRDHLPS